MDTAQAVAVLALIANLQLGIQQLQAENVALRAQIAELDRRREQQEHG